MDLTFNNSLLQNHFSNHIPNLGVDTHLINPFYNDFCLAHTFCNLLITTNRMFKK